MKLLTEIDHVTTFLTLFSFNCQDKDLPHVVFYHILCILCQTILAFCMGKWGWDASDKFDRLEIQQKNVTRELLDEGITSLIFLEKNVAD